ncbi:MAG: hypothetical protein KKC84_05495, partial [Candidatus Omnitrophica bacterium]|nr:hypothetical protein [Candidatus Omnitrophota bacterium]
AGLLLLEMMVYRNKNMLQILRAVEKQFGKYFYVRDDLQLESRMDTPARKALPDTLLGKKVVQIKDYDGIKLICADQSWLMFRGSGTEPIMRIYAEAKNLAKANKLLLLGRELIRKSSS